MGKKAKRAAKAAKRAAKAAALETGVELELEPSGPLPGRRLERRFQAAIATPWRTTPINAYESGDHATEVGGLALLQWARHLDQNNPIAVAVLDEIVNQVVGSGILIDPDPRDARGNELPRLKAELVAIREEHSEAVDVTGELSEHEYQRMELRSYARDGEVFSQHVAGRTRGYEFRPDEVPYRVELLESEMVPIDYSEGLGVAGRGWRQGVRLDSWRRPRAYAVYRHQPNDFLHGSGAVTQRDIKSVQAQWIEHLKNVRRWPQVRGVSVFAAVMRTIFDLGEYEESERIAARVAASLTGFLKRDPGTWPKVTAEQAESAKQREFSLDTVNFFDDLLPGEEIASIKSERPNNALIDFRRELIRSIAAGTGSRYSPVARDFNGTYSSQRQELAEAQFNYDYLRNVYTAAGPRARHRRLVLTAVLDRKVVIPRGATLRSISRAQYVAPVMPGIDQLKEAQAAQIRAELDQETPEDRRRRRGGIIEQEAGR